MTKSQKILRSIPFPPERTLLRSADRSQSRCLLRHRAVFRLAFAMKPVIDRLGRPLRSLRVSVTDRCNLRCHYCMPEADYVWLPRTDLLSFEETARAVSIF